MGALFLNGSFNGQVMGKLQVAMMFPVGLGSPPNWWFRVLHVASILSRVLARYQRRGTARRSQPL